MIPSHWLDGSGAFYFTLAGILLFLFLILTAAFLAGRFLK